MQKLTALMIALITCLMSVGQSPNFQRGQIDVNVGVGFGTPLFAITGYDIKTLTPPISLVGDYGVSDDISVGLYLAKASSAVQGTLINFSTGSFRYARQSTLSHTIIGGRVLYHFELHPKFDTYAGGMLGFNAFSEKAEDRVELIGDTNVSGFSYTILAGGRYHFAKNLGAFVELGYGVTIVNLGLTLKFLPKHL